MASQYNILYLKPFDQHHKQLIKPMSFWIPTSRMLWQVRDNSPKTQVDYFHMNLQDSPYQPTHDIPRKQKLNWSAYRNSYSLPSTTIFLQSHKIASISSRMLNLRKRMPLRSLKSSNDHYHLHMNPITMHPNYLVLHLVLLLHAQWRFWGIRTKWYYRTKSIHLTLIVPIPSNF
jgi:hypothetical protein